MATSKNPDSVAVGRGSVTRARILEATVAALFERGFAATSTLQIQADAGVSRGRLLHHFPSKQLLMVAAVQHLAAERFEQLRATTIASEGAARARRAIELMWSAFDGELFWAAVELWIGSRTDDALRQALAVEERRLGHVVRVLCDDLFGPELTMRPGYQDLRDVLISSMRGVALTYSFDRRVMEDEPHIATWHRLALDHLGLDEK
jgi:AcrR family transcriptional regulator